MLKAHAHFTVMQSVEVLHCDWVLAEVDALLLVVGVQGLTVVMLADKVLIDSLCRKGLVVKVIDHEVQQRHLISN